MDQNNRDLLLRDLSARLPYRVKISTNRGPELMEALAPFSLMELKISGNFDFTDLVCFKPYLRSMLSMTDDERKEYNDIVKNTIDFYDCPKSEEICFFVILIDWLNAHHFDYRGLIKKGLAIEAPEGMYKLTK